MFSLYKVSASNHAPSMLKIRYRPVSIFTIPLEWHRVKFHEGCAQLRARSEDWAGGWDCSSLVLSSPKRQSRSESWHVESILFLLSAISQKQSL